VIKLDDEGLDIDNWSLDELKDIVAEFKVTHHPSINAEQEQFDEYPERSLNGIPSNRITVIESVEGQESILLKAISSNFKLYEKTIQMQPSPLNESKISG